MTRTIDTDGLCDRCECGAHAANQELVELVDGAYEIVELFNATSPAQIEWKRAWLEKARKHGASGE